jgi:hypothetical protein
MRTRVKPFGVRAARFAAVVALLTAVLQFSSKASAQVSVSPTSPTSTAAAVQQIGSGAGLETIAGCVNANGRLLVQVLFDSSGSLGKSDPENLRVPALKAALGSLLSISNTQSAKGPTQVEVAVSGFDDNFYGVEDFRKLDSSSIESFLNVADGFSEKNRGEWTDYVLALRGASEALEVRSAQLQSEGIKPCKAIFWFTDGDYDISGTGFGSKDYAPDRGGRDAQAAGRLNLCEVGGLADQLRQAGIVNVAVALNTSGYPTELLDGIVLGSSTCGVADGANRYGVVLGVSDVNRLTQTMLEAISGTRGQQLSPGEVCSADPCAKKVEVRVPVGVGSFYLLTRANEGVQRWITPPGGQPMLVEQGRKSLGSSQLETTRISPTTSMIDVTLDKQDPATGVWTVSFVDPTGKANGTSGEVEAYFFGALRPQIDPSSEIRLGEEADIVIDVVDASGSRVDLATAQGTRLSVVVTDPVTDPSTGAVARPTLIGPDTEGRFIAKYTASMSSKAAAMNVFAALSVVMDGGLSLRPTIAESAIPVTVPVTVPSLETTELVLPKVEGRSTTKGTLTVKGPERGAGIACVLEWNTDRVPKGVESISIESSDNCETVQQGSTKELQVALRPDNQGDGYVRGFVEVRLTAESNPIDSVTKSVPVDFRLIRSTSAPVQWVTALGLTLLSLFLPLLGFYLLLVSMTRFRGLDRLQWAEVPIRIENGVLTRTDIDSDGGAFGTTSNFRSKVEGEWNLVGGSGGRSFSVGRNHLFTVFVLDRISSMSMALITVDAAEIAGRSIGHDRLRRRKGIVAPLENLSGQWGIAIDSIEFPPIDSGFGATEQDTTLDMPLKSVVTGSVLMFVDDFHGWRSRGDEIFINVAVAAPGCIEPFVATAWKSHCKQATDGAFQTEQLASVSTSSWDTSMSTGQSQSSNDAESSDSGSSWSPDTGNKESPW